MSVLSGAVIALVALLHFYFLVLEMFLWDKPAGLRAFGNTLEKAAATKVLAANQGLYNGFLAAGLLWGLWLGAEGFGVKLFFLLCVLVAGLYGAATASRKILFVQALHQVEVARRRFPRIVALRDGVIVYDGAASAFTDAQVSALYGTSGLADASAAEPSEDDDHAPRPPHEVPVAIICR